MITEIFSMTVKTFLEIGIFSTILAVRNTFWENDWKALRTSQCTLHTGLTPTRKSHRDSCWQFGCQALTGLGWLRNHVKVMGERKNSQLILQVYLNLNIIRWLRRYEMKMKRKNNS